MSTVTTRLAILGAALPGFCASVQAQQQQRPNIIHIMTDDHALQAIGCLGHPISQLAQTPNIDRIGYEGAIFRNAFVVNSISAPSRATLLTGKYSHINGQMTNGNTFDRDQPTFVSSLREQGYQTAVIGKWHLRSMPAGFDYYKILWDQGEYYHPEFANPDTNGEYVREQGYVTDIITDNSIDWIRNRDKDKPFCLLLHHKAPHRNWMPDIKYLNLYEDVEFPYPTTLFDDMATRTEAARTSKMSIERDMTLSYDLKVDAFIDKENPRWSNMLPKSIDRLTQEQKEAWYAFYGPENEKMIEANLSGEELVKWKYQRYIKDNLRCIRSVDDGVGKLLEFLEKEGLLDNTIIVYTSDQGFYLGEHGWFDKRFMYEESLRMPMLMRYPRLIAPGTTIDALVQNIDYAPTYLDVAGVDIPSEIQGHSVVPLLDDKKHKNWRESIYYHYYEYPGTHQVRMHYGVRDNRYKLIHFYGKARPASNDTDNLDEWEFYDLKKDPLEIRNLYGKAKYLRKITRMKRELTRLRTEFNAIDNPRQ